MLELYFDSKTRGSLKQTIIKSVLAGVYVAFGSFFFLTVRALPNLEVISALVFPLGLILCVLAGGNLFNIDCLAIGSKIPKFGSYLALAYIFNCMGALLAAYLIFLAGVEPEGAITLAANKNDLPLFLAFWRGIICNILIGVAAIVAFNTTNTFGKIAILTLPLACFITPNAFEGSVSGMFFLSYGLLLGANMAIWDVAATIALTALGNIVGGFIIGYIYLNVLKEDGLD